MILGQLALIAAAIFAGAAVYVSLVEHPARRMLDAPAMLAEWKPAYARGTVMQGPLALIGFMFGVAAWWIDGSIVWLSGALLMFANWPYTLIVIMPVNRALSALKAEDVGRKARPLLERWAALHAGRTVLGFAATGAFLVASLD